MDWRYTQRFKRSNWIIAWYMIEHVVLVSEAGLKHKSGM